MKKEWKWAIAAGAVLLLTGALVLFFYFFLPYHHAQSAMPADTVLLLEEQLEGSLVLSWPAADRADFYSVEVLRPGEKEELLFADFVRDGLRCTLGDVPRDEPVILRVNTVVNYDEDDPEKVRMGEIPAQVEVTLAMPRIEDLSWTADEDADTVSVSFSKAVNDDCRIYVKNEDGSYRLLKTVGTDQTLLTFGEGGELPIPEHGETVTIAMDAFRESEKLDLSGTVSQSFTLTREDFLGRELALSITDEGRNIATLTWDETKGQRYQIQMKRTDDADWTVLGELAADAERTFTTHHLPVMGEMLFRVVALGGQTLADTGYAAVSEEISFTTVESPIYATIWPTANLKTYADPAMTQEVGTVKAATAYCVLDETDGAFAVGVNGQVVYINSTHCLINLPEYIGDLCSYDITNSYSSIYMIHEYEIPRVTDVVTGGYEQVKLEDGSYLVPLLYPTAKKLAAAAKTALEQGYRLKIYDAFRPNRATVEIYDRTESILDNDLPKETFKGGVMYDLPRLPAKENEDDPDPVMTYRIVMTNNASWGLNSFLARGASLHNYGIAVDLTLETLEGQELAMQTSMHDLSFYSVLSRNNENANILAAIMKSAGLGELVSEWWHFQDNEVRQKNQLNCVWAGVSPECWMKDDRGWRYRRYNGTYFTGGEFDIYGTMYTFDEEGYIVNN